MRVLALVGWIGCGQDLPEPEDVCTDEVAYDGIDQDCAGGDLVDVDADGFDAAEVGGDDCDDGDPAIHPDAAEVPYDGIDQDCAAGDLVDVDADGYGLGTDCDDDDPTIHPDAVEVPYDGIDQDCADGDLVDVDADGYDLGADCDDDRAEVHPGAPDTVGNDVDDDCDGRDGVDRDQDGFASVASGGDDCRDGDVTVNPGAPEIWYDGVDQDCDRRCDDDQDGDGAVVPGSSCPNPVFDCNDLDPRLIAVTIGTTTPEDHATRVDPEAPIVVTLTEADPTASIVVYDWRDQVAPGTVDVVADTVAWTPSAPLLAGANYRVDVVHGCGTETFFFWTEYDSVAVDPEALVGRVWSFGEGGVWTTPGEAGVLLDQKVGIGFLVEVLAADDDTLDLRIASRGGGYQALCFHTTDLVADFSANPTFASPPFDLSQEWSWAYESYVLAGATVSGEIRGDGEAVVDVSFAATLDTRSFADLLPYSSPPLDPPCERVAAAGGACVECPDGSGPFCLAVEVEGLEATLERDPLVQILEDRADANCP